MLHTSSDNEITRLIICTGNGNMGELVHFVSHMIQHICVKESLEFTLPCDFNKCFTVSVFCLFDKE